LFNSPRSRLTSGIALQYCADPFTTVMQTWEDKAAVQVRRGKRLATRVTVSVDERDYEQLSALADQHRVSLAWLVRYAVGDFLDRYRRDQLELPLELTSRRR
jgi:Ribbon-helix-helix protein, copG family